MSLHTAASPCEDGTNFFVRVQLQDIDISGELEALRRGCGDAGAVVNFIGYVRQGMSDNPLSALTLEHYPGMTECAIAGMITIARSRFKLLGVRIIHRAGILPPGARIVLVAVAAAHRRAAFEGCEFLMDYLKVHAPFWKKETRQDGEHWVEARGADDDALARWGIASTNGRGSRA